MSLSLIFWCFVSHSFVSYLFHLPVIFYFKNTFRSNMFIQWPLMTMPFLILPFLFRTAGSVLIYQFFKKHMCSQTFLLLGISNPRNERLPFIGNKKERKRICYIRSLGSSLDYFVMADRNFTRVFGIGAVLKDFEILCVPPVPLDGILRTVWPFIMTYVLVN